MKKLTLRKIKQILSQQQEQLLQQANQELAIDIEGDETDKIQGNMLMGIATQLGQRNTIKLQQITQALSKIDQGEYGSCQDCEEEIPEKRLLSNPYVLRCIFCAEQLEMMSKHIRR